MTMIVFFFCSPHFKQTGLAFIIFLEKNRGKNAHSNITAQILKNRKNLSFLKNRVHFIRQDNWALIYCSEFAFGIFFYVCVCLCIKRGSKQCIINSINIFRNFQLCANKIEIFRISVHFLTPIQSRACIRKNRKCTSQWKMLENSALLNAETGLEILQK